MSTHCLMCEKYKAQLAEAKQAHDNTRKLWERDKRGKGAIARCSYCGRYTDDRRALLADPPPCQCGWQYGWSGSFEPPTEASEWSTHNNSIRQHDSATTGVASVGEPH